MNFDELYRDTVNQINPSPKLIRNIKSVKEEKVVKINTRKLIITVIAACMILGSTVFATGHIAAYYSWENSNSKITAYNVACKIFEEKNLSAVIPEKLSNGYHFSCLNRGVVKGDDNADQTVAEDDLITVTYTNNQHPDITLFIQPVFEEEDLSSSLESRSINGITAYYSQDTYKFVPTDYELTEEDRQKLEDPSYNISYGSDKDQTELKILDSVYFQIDGENYNLLSWDNHLSTDDWFNMTEEFLN